MPLKPRKRGKVVLTDGVLLALTKRSDVTSKFPFFRISTKIATGTCGGCGSRGQRNERMAALTGLKVALAGLSESQKGLFKSLLKADKVVFHVPGPSGVVSHTF